MNELPGLLVPEHVLACPFCGGTDISYVCFVPVDAQQPKKDAGTKTYHALCKTCEAMGPRMMNGVDAFVTWNYRRLERTT